MADQERRELERLAALGDKHVQPPASYKGRHMKYLIILIILTGCTRHKPTGKERFKHEFRVNYHHGM